MKLYFQMTPQSQDTFIHMAQSYVSCEALIDLNIERWAFFFFAVHLHNMHLKEDPGVYL